MCSKDGTKERSISHQRTNTQRTQIDILEMTCIPRRNVSLLHGKFPLYITGRKQERLVYMVLTDLFFLLTRKNMLICSFY